MTNKEVFSAYDNYLQKMFHCYADENGNRPCDNGALCERCLYPSVPFEVFMMKKEKEKRG